MAGGAWLLYLRKRLGGVSAGPRGLGGGLLSSAISRSRGQAQTPPALGNPPLATSTSGAIAQNLGGLVQAAIGVETFSGEASQILGGLTQSANGAETFLSSVSQNLGGLTQTANAIESFAGSIAQHLGGLRQAASGVEIFLGTISQNLGSLTQAASGAETFSGEASQNLGGLTQAASGLVVTPISAAIAQALGGLTQAASGTNVAPASGGGFAPVMWLGARPQEDYRDPDMPTPPVEGLARQTLGGLGQTARARSVPQLRRGGIAQRLGSLSQAVFTSAKISGTASQSLGSLQQSGSLMLTLRAQASQGLGGLTQIAQARKRNPDRDEARLVRARRR